MLRGELEAAAADFLEVSQVRTATSPLALLDVVREKSGEPERPISEVNSNEKGSARVAIVHVIHQRGKRVVHLVVGVADAFRSTAWTKGKQHGSEIVAQGAIALAGTQQRVPHHDVQKQRKRRVRAEARLDQRDGKALVVENRVEALIHEPLLDTPQLLDGIMR